MVRTGQGASAMMRKASELRTKPKEDSCSMCGVRLVIRVDCVKPTPAFDFLKAPAGKGRPIG
jgi:hypothetical protein